MYVCMYVCVCLCVCMCLSVCMYVCALRVILNMLLVIDFLTAFGTSKYEYREYTHFFFFNLGQYCTCARLVKFNNI